MKNKKAVAAGYTCVDITPVFPENARKVDDLREILKPGKLINVLAPDIHTGGSVSNTGLAMKVLGADVKLIGKIGADYWGEIIREIFSRYNAASDLIVTPSETTGYTFVLAVPGIDRIFMTCPGANDSFDGSEISDEVLNDVALFHFGYPPVMRKMFIEEGKYLVNMFKRIKAMGIATSLDLSAIDLESEAGSANWQGILANVLPYVDFFVPSFEELCLILDRERYERLSKLAGNSDITNFLDLNEDIIPLAKKCLALGAKAVLLKCGEPGLFLMTSSKISEVGERLELDSGAWENFCRFEKSFKIPQVLSGTGAGDVSIAAFLVSLLEGKGPGEAVENAAAAGALCCLSYDAVSSLKTLAEIRKLIDSGWEKAY